MDTRLPRQRTSCNRALGSRPDRSIRSCASTGDNGEAWDFSPLRPRQKIASTVGGTDTSALWLCGSDQVDHLWHRQCSFVALSDELLTDPLRRLTMKFCTCKSRMRCGAARSNSVLWLPRMGISSTLCGDWQWSFGLENHHGLRCCKIKLLWHSSTSCSSVHDLADGQHLRVEVSCGSSWRKKRTSGWLVNCPAIVPEFGRMSDTPFSVSCRCYPFPCVALPSRF